MQAKEWIYSPELVQLKFMVTIKHKSKVPHQHGGRKVNLHAL